MGDYGLYRTSRDDFLVAGIPIRNSDEFNYQARVAFKHPNLLRTLGYDFNVSNVFGASLD